MSKTLTEAFYLFPGQGAPEGVWGEGLTGRDTENRIVREITEGVYHTVNYVVQQNSHFPSVEEIAVMPEQQKMLPSHTHVGTFAVCMAQMIALEALVDKEGAALVRKGSAGHSVGQTVSVAAAGWLSMEDAVVNTIERGLSIDQRVNEARYCMWAVVGLDEMAMEDVARESGVYITNVNSDRVIVIGSGSKRDMANALDFAKARGSKRQTQLKVPTVFHSPIMDYPAQLYGNAVASLVSGSRVRETLRIAEGNSAAPVVISDLDGSVLRPSKFGEYASLHLVTQVRFKDSATAVTQMAAANPLRIVAFGPNKEAVNALRSSFLGKEVNGKPVEIIPCYNRETLYSAAETLVA